MLPPPLRRRHGFFMPLTLPRRFAASLDAAAATDVLRR